MPIDVKLLIENEFEAFKDPIEKRGPRHRSQKIGLNLNRKHQNVVAVSQKADPNAVGPLERLRKLQHGRGFVTFQVGDELKQKYGLNTDDGYLGTTGIRLLRTDKGYELIKEAAVNIEGIRYNIKNPDDLFEFPGSARAFALYDGIIYYGPDTHYAIVEELLSGTPKYVKTYPTKPSREQHAKFVSSYLKFQTEWLKTASKHERAEWNTFGNPRRFFELTGRYSFMCEDPVINAAAFWNDAASVNKHAKLLSGFFTAIGLTNPIIVALDNPNMKLGQNVVTQKIDRQAMEKQHLVPALKKMNTASQYNKSGEVAAKAGYQSPAELNAHKTIGDSVTPVKVVAETPEVIMGKYPREDYISYLFLGTVDSKGAVFVPEKTLSSHSRIVQALSKNQLQGITFLGNATADRKQYTHYKAGVILPKQPGIEATYISCWSAQGKEILPFIDAYMKQIGAQGPYFIEISNIEHATATPGQLEEYTPSA